MADNPRDLTRLLHRLNCDNSQAANELVPLIYNELRQLAAACMRREQAGHTLQPTALVHEAYLRLMGQRNVQWNDRAHFFAVAATLMRRVLLDYARKSPPPHRGGGPPPAGPSGGVVVARGEIGDVLARLPLLPPLGGNHPPPRRPAGARGF